MKLFLRVCYGIMRRFAASFFTSTGVHGCYSNSLLGGSAKKDVGKPVVVVGHLCRTRSVFAGVKKVSVVDRRGGPAMAIVRSLQSNPDVDVANLSSQLQTLVKGNEHWMDKLKRAMVECGADETRLEQQMNLSRHRYIVATSNSELLKSKEDVAMVLDTIQALIKGSRSSHNQPIHTQPMSLVRLATHFRSRTLTTGRCLLLCCNSAALVVATERLMWGKLPVPVTHLEEHQVSFLKIVKPDKVTMLAGESGAGKTHALFTSNPDRITVVLMFDDDFAPTKKDTKKTKGDFLAFVVEHVAEAIAEPKVGIESQGFGVWTDALSEDLRNRIHIVIDEAHGRQNIVSYLCRWRKDVAAALVQKGAPFEGLDQESLHFLCAGTGISLFLNREISCEPNTCQIFTLEPQLEWRLLCPEANERSTPEERVMSSMVGAALEHPCLAQLQENARAALLCYQQLAKLANSLEGYEEDELLDTRARNTVGRSAHHVFDAVVRKFKDMNALRELSPKEMEKLGLAAFRLLFCEDEVTSKHSRNFAIEELVGTYGVVADMAIKIPSTHSPPDGYIVATKWRATAADDGCKYCVPSCGRYTMSCTLAAILASYPDHSPLELSDPSWGTLKRQAAQAMFLAAAVCKTPEELYRCIDCNGPPSRPGDKFQFRTVNLVVLPTPFSGGETHEESVGRNVMKGFKEHMKTVKDRKAAYVFINATGAPYADVFFIAHGIVVLLHALDHRLEIRSDNYLVEALLTCGLSPEQAPVQQLSPLPAEYRSCEATQMLCDAAGIDRSGVVFALVRSSVIPPAEVRSLHSIKAISKYINLCFPTKPPPGKRFPEKHDLMYPLLWPPRGSAVAIQASTVPICCWK